MALDLKKKLGLGGGGIAALTSAMLLLDQADNRYANAREVKRLEWKIRKLEKKIEEKNSQIEQILRKLGL